MGEMTWKKLNFSHGRYSLCLSFKLKDKTLSGCIDVNERHQKADFTFQSLGGKKKIKFALDEEMQKEAEEFLLKKLATRISEFTQMKEILENKKSS